jgi:hypothetical protein
MEKLAGSLIITLLAAGYLAGGDRTLNLIIYDHAHVGEETLTNAENTASGIFRQAGIQVRWREGFAYAAERRNAAVRIPEDPASLVVKLQPESEAARYGVRPVCGGIGLPSGAIIFVRRFDSTHLGVVMAHEIGHMVLGPNAHAIVGIMRATILAEDWAQAERGTLGFTRSQGKGIREWIDRRIAAIWVKTPDSKEGSSATASQSSSSDRWR